MATLSPWISLNIIYITKLLVHEELKSPDISFYEDRLSWHLYINGCARQFCCSSVSVEDSPALNVYHRPSRCLYKCLLYPVLTPFLFIHTSDRHFWYMVSTFLSSCLCCPHILNKQFKAQTNCYKIWWCGRLNSFLSKPILNTYRNVTHQNEYNFKGLPSSAFWNCADVYTNVVSCDWTTVLIHDI